MKHEERYAWFDLARGLSAFAVLAAHLRAVVFVDFSELTAPTLFDRAFYFATGLGYQAVMVFFVLSGFFVGGSILRRAEEFRWRDYGVARLTRLWMVLVPALLLTLLVDAAIKAADPGALSGDYRAFWNSGPPAAAGAYSATAITFAGNVFFLQTVLVPVFGSNTPLWSLANEFWYYLVFPLAATALGVAGAAAGVKERMGRNRARAACVRILTGALALVLLVSLPRGIVIGFGVWMLGVLLWLVESKSHPDFIRGSVPSRSRQQLFAMAGLAVFLGTLVYSRSSALQSRLQLPGGAVVGIGFTVFAVFLLRLPLPLRARAFFLPFSRAIAEFSYSLYLFHFPVVLLIGITCYAGEHSQRQPGAGAWLQYAGWLLAITAGAAVFWWLFEKRTASFRRLFRPRP